VALVTAKRNTTLIQGSIADSLKMNTTDQNIF
jgi:hypothetical protein